MFEIKYTTHRSVFTCSSVFLLESFLTSEVVGMSSSCYLFPSFYFQFLTKSVCVSCRKDVVGSYFLVYLPSQYHLIGKCNYLYIQGVYSQRCQHGSFIFPSIFLSFILNVLSSFTINFLHSHSFIMMDSFPISVCSIFLSMNKARR